LETASLPNGPAKGEVQTARLLAKSIVKSREDKENNLWTETSRWGDEKLGKLASPAQKALRISLKHNKKSSDVNPGGHEEYKHEFDL